MKSLQLDKFDALDHKKWRNLLTGRQVSGDESGDSGDLCWLTRVNCPGEMVVKRVCFLVISLS